MVEMMVGLARIARDAWAEGGYDTSNLAFFVGHRSQKAVVQLAGDRVSRMSVMLRESPCAA